MSLRVGVVHGRHYEPSCSEVAPRQSGPSGECDEPTPLPIHANATVIAMTTDSPRHAYQATFHSTAIDGGLICPSCKDTLLHPTGHTRQLEQHAEYGPTVGVVAACECGAVVEIRIGNYKGNLGMDAELVDW